MTSENTIGETQAAAGNASGEKVARSGCCGGAAPQGADACCALDADIKATGGAGCGCAAKKASGAKQKGGCC